MLLLRAALLLLWVAWFYPFLFRAPHRQNRASITRAGPTRAGLILESVAIAIGAFSRPLDPPATWRIVAGLALAAWAIPMAWSAVRHLGRQFRVNAGLYEDHQLVRTGAYGIIRHPIYGSLMAMMGTVLFFLATWQLAVISVVLFVIGTEIRVRTEDRLLASRFGAEFEQYRRRVRAYIPLVR